MVGVRRGHGDDSVYFDAANGLWVGSVSLGYAADGKRRRRTVRGRTKTEVRDKLRGLKEDISASVRAPAGYTVWQAVEDWLDSGLDSRSAATVSKYRTVLKPVAQQIGRAVLRDLTAHDVRKALTVLAREQASSTVAIAHNALTRAIRHAESRDLVRRNVSALVDTPSGQTGRPSKALTIEQTRKLIAVASDISKHRLGAYVALCLQTGIRTEEARALTWSHVDLDGRPDDDPPLPPSIAVWRSVREHGDTKTRTSRRTLGLPAHAVEVLRDHWERQQAERKYARDGWQDNDLVFCTGLGGKLDAGNVRRQFKLITRDAGLGEDWSHRSCGTPSYRCCRRPGRQSRRSRGSLATRAPAPPK